MTPILSTSGHSSTSSAAIGLIAFGYWLGTTRLEDLDRLVNSIVVPLYTCVVFIYITLRLYHLVIEPRLVQAKKEPVLAPIGIDQSITQAEQPVDLTGHFQLMENHNYEAFLASQGVPWALRSAANRARPTHLITHQGNLLTIKIEGIIQSQTTYQINGPKQQVKIRGRRFEDSVTYIESSGIQTIKRAMDDGYSIQVCRVLSDDKQQIIMTNTVTFDDDTKDKISCKQIFQRMKE
jgi:hypothetical protein